MIARRSIVMVLIWMLPTAVWAQEPLSEDAKKRIVEHLQSLMESDPAMLDPIDPVRIEMHVWGNDAITNTIREVPSEKVLYLYGEYGRIGSRDRAFLPSGELSDLVINSDYAINAEAAWRHNRDSIEVGSQKDSRLESIPKLLAIQRDTFRSLLFQGLYTRASQSWKLVDISGDVDGWSAIWALHGADRQMQVRGAGDTPERLRVLSLSFRTQGGDEEQNKWQLGRELKDHQPIPWRTGLYPRDLQAYRDGQPFYRYAVKSLDMIEKQAFEVAVRTPDPKQGHVPVEAVRVVDSRGTHTTEWAREGEAFVEGPSLLNVRRVLVYCGVIVAAVAGVAAAFAVSKRSIR